jgi:hypothetical protein
MGKFTFVDRQEQGPTSPAASMDYVENKGLVLAPQVRTRTYDPLVNTMSPKPLQSDIYTAAKQTVTVAVDAKLHTLAFLSRRSSVSEGHDVMTQDAARRNGALLRRRQILDVRG